MLVNALRGHLAEFGATAAKGIYAANKLIGAQPTSVGRGCPRWRAAVSRRSPPVSRSLGRASPQSTGRSLEWHRGSEISCRLETIAGTGVITASALAATVVDPHRFSSGRWLAAWIGLVPRQNGTGGKMQLGKISKQGDRYLRRLLVLGATALVRYTRNKLSALGVWITGLLARRPARLLPWRSPTSSRGSPGR